MPRFDGDPVFGALVDPTHGGRWSIAPAGARVSHREYRERAASIRTTWDGEAGVVAVTDGMIADSSSRLIARTTLVRHVACLAGEADVEMVFDPRLGMPGRKPARAHATTDTLYCSWSSIAASLSNDGGLVVRPGERQRFHLRGGESVTFVLGVAHREPMVVYPPSSAALLLDEDDRWWRSWTDKFDRRGLHEDLVIRSLITLRLLIYAPSGAPVAAPTTSIPAPLGSHNTWDYRFSWPRDASIGVDAFLAFSGEEEPRVFFEWFINASRVTRPELHVLYNLDGRPIRHENDIKGVDGYADGRPVRVGNAAASQYQLDVYGWVLDAAYRFHESQNTLLRAEWRSLRAFADTVAKRWREPDNGIWEERGAPRQHVHSKLMAWTGLDRAVKLAGSYRAPHVRRWMRERDELRSEIMRHGFDEDRGVYVRVYDEPELDASTLVAATLGFEHDRHRMTSTIDAIRRELGAGGPLLYRNLRDGVPVEGAFLPCSFWLVQALARSGKIDEAGEAFESLCGMATPLGLYAEQIDPATKAHIGNYPLAFSHATFLQAAALLSAARETGQESGRKPRAQPDLPAASARRS